MGQLLIAAKDLPIYNLWQQLHRADDTDEKVPISDQKCSYLRCRRMANQSNTSTIAPFASYFIRPFNRNNGAYGQKQVRNKRNTNSCMKISMNEQCVEQCGAFGY